MPRSEFTRSRDRAHAPAWSAPHIKDGSMTPGPPVLSVSGTIHNGYHSDLNKAKVVMIRRVIALAALALLVLTSVASAQTVDAGNALDGAVEVSLEAHARAPVDEGGPVHYGPALPVAGSFLVIGPLDGVRLDASVRSSGAVAAQPQESAAQSGAAAFAEALPDVVAEAAPAAVAAVGLIALVQAFGGFRVLGVGAVALYSRLTKSDMLDNEHRDKVYKLVQEQPGVGMTEVCKRIQIGWGTAVYHLERLEKAGFVASERSGMHRCYFPVGTVPKADRQGIGALKMDTTRSLAAFLVQRPGASQSEVCEALGLSASAASKQVSKLETAGLVRREREWKTVHLYPEPTLSGLLGESPEVPPMNLAGSSSSPVLA